VADIVDFGKNTFLLEVAFKLDALSSSDIFTVVNEFVVRSTAFTDISKNAETGETVLSQGTGEADTPYLQLRLKPDKMVVWAGWHTGFDRWRELRAALLTLLATKSETLSIAPTLLATISSTVSIVVPHSHVRPGHMRNDLQPLLVWLTKFVPEEMQAKGANLFIYSNEHNTRRIEFSHTGLEETAEDTINYTYRWLGFDSSTDVLSNISKHTEMADTLFSDFHEFYIKPGVSLPRVPLKR
jgi:hypothetical protein